MLSDNIIDKFYKVLIVVARSFNQLSRRHGYTSLRLMDTLHKSVMDVGKDAMADTDNTVALFEPSAADKDVINVLSISPIVER